MAKWWFVMGMILTATCAVAQTDSLASLPPYDYLINKSTADTLVVPLQQDSLATEGIGKPAPPPATQTTSATKDTISTKRPLIRDFGLYIDYGKLFGLLFDYEQKYEGGVRLILGNDIFVGAEYGQARINPQLAFKHANYEVNGTYMRFGAGRLSALNAKTNIGFGLFYAMANFGDKSSPKLPNTTGLPDKTDATFERTGLTATWYEFNFISESQLRKNIYAGINIRFRVMGRYDSQSPDEVYTVPGYGRTFDKTLPAANLFVRWKVF